MQNSKETPESISADSRQSYIVDWDGDEDVSNPQNWPSGRKRGIIILVSALTFLEYVLALWPYEANGASSGPWLPQSLRRGFLS